LRTKIAPDSIVDIQRLPDGRIAWLEVGDVGSGLAHILKRHSADFANKQIPPAQVSNIIFRVLQQGKVVGHAGDGTPIRALMINGNSVRVKVVLGSNGYIVSAYPVA